MLLIFLEIMHKMIAVVVTAQCCKSPDITVVKLKIVSHVYRVKAQGVS